MSSFAEYLHHDGTSLAALIRQREISAAEACEAAIAQAERMQPLNAICTRRFEKAMDEARRGTFSGPLAGVPFLLKDLLMGTEDMPISFGSHALKDFTLARTPTLVKRYQAAGLNIIGMTQTAELGLQPVTESRRYGAARNPWNPEHNAGGSSGGSAAAVAARITAMANATDGGGSIRIPASMCGVFGFKPSRALVPLTPYGDLWDGAVVCHAITRSVRDSALLLDISAGADSGSTVTPHLPAGGYLAALEVPLRPLRVGYFTGSPLGGPVDAACVAAVHQATALLSEAGHIVESLSSLWDGEALLNDFLPVLLANVASDMRFIGQQRTQPLRRREFEDATWLLAQGGRALSAERYASAKRRWANHVATMAELFSRYDVVLTPTQAIEPPRNGELQPTRAETLALKCVGALRLGGAVATSAGFAEAMLKSFLPFPYTLMASVTGCPAASVPMDHSPAGLPIGIQLMAPCGKDTLILQLARFFEQVAPWQHRLPQLLS